VNEYRIGDCLTVLRTLPDGFAHTCVTSPPYWGLRDYGHDGQIGLEETPDAYVERMVAVFREVRRVLRDDGTLWLNLGDSYATGAGKVGDRPGGGAQGDGWQGAKTSPNRLPIEGLKPKDLVGIPWRVAFALQADGWYLRSDIIWHKPNPMPESVTDRPTKAHEYVFLMSKSPRYYYDADAIKERSFTGSNAVNRAARVHATGGAITGGTSDIQTRSETKNKRSVWTVTTRPFSGAHFACYPPELIKPCIAAGCPETTCAICGAPWIRITQRIVDRVSPSKRYEGTSKRNDADSPRVTSHRETLGWEPTCEHNERGQGGIVLDPFFGSGTTGMVAESLGRRWFGIELNPEYEPLIRQRTAQRGLL